MHPILFKFGPFCIYSYGVMIAIGFGLATACIYHRAPKLGIDRNNVVDLMIIMLVSGIAGARIFYVLQNLEYYSAYPLEIFDLSRGGLAWYGSFIAGLASCAVYIRIRRMDFWSAVDLAAPYIALAQGIGRIGCFLNGCCYGIEAPRGFALAVASPHDNLMHIPSQLISALLLILIFVILRIWQDHRRFHGEIFLGYCLLYSLKRFAVEFIRGDNPRILLNLTLSQLISCIIFIISIAVFILMVARWKKR